MKNYQAMLKLILSCPPTDEHDPLERDLINYFDQDYTYWLNDLKGQKLISSSTKRENYQNTGHNFWYVRLTNEGLHYFDKRKEDTKKFWYRSILVPIGVSIATTLITTLLSHWLN